MNIKLLEGKTAIITGGSSGVGLCMGQLFADEGANVVLTGRRKEALDEAVKAITDKGGKAIGLSGTDGRLIEATMKDERLGFVGDVTKVNIEPVVGLLEKGYIPVISTIGCDQEGNV